MSTRSLADQIYRLTLLPVLVISLTLGAVLSYLHVQHLNSAKTKYIQTLGWQMAALLSPVLENGTHDALRQATQGLIENGVLINLCIYDENKKRIYHRGKQTLENPDFPEKVDEVFDDSKKHLSFPIMNRTLEHPIGWLYGEIDNTFFNLLKYQTLTLVLLVALLACLMAIALSTVFSRRLIAPIRELKQGIEHFRNGFYSHEIVIHQDDEFGQLANELNTMADKIALSRQELQNNVDQSMQDIRETLETIEIQNVELDIARKQALEASRIKSEFLASTSHEIRTPLNGIIGFTSLMFKTDLDSQQLDYLRTIESSAQNLLAIINDILDFSRIESGTLSLNNTPFNLRQTIEETLQILSPLAHEKNLNLINFVDTQTPLHLIGDPLRLRQVLTNLINNAIKFSHSGNVLINVASETIEDNHCTLKFSVTDYGIGVSPEQARNLFKAFSSGSGADSLKQGGTGLGLAISKGLVEKMGGRIGLHNQVNTGAVFWFTVKMGIDLQANQRPYHALQNSNIMVVEENEDAFRQLEQLLLQWNVNVIRLPSLDEVSDVTSAIQSKQSTPALLLYSTQPADLYQHQAEITLSQLHDINYRYNCKIICLCHANEQRRLQALKQDTCIRFINKPIMHDRLYVNICEELQLEAQLSYEHRKALPNHLPARQLNVLAVDDNRANLILVSEFLTGLGASVVQATNGTDAISLASKNHFDLIFMDVKMPDMDGMEATRQIRLNEKTEARTPIIALTAHALDEQKAPLLLAGMDDFLSKPVGEDQLKRVIQRWCKNVDISPSTDNQPIKAGIHEKRKALSGPVDLTNCLKLSNYKPDLARDMLQMLLNNLTDERAKITKAFEDKNHPQLADHVHKLHGSCCYVGVPQLREIASLTDKMLEKNKTEHLEERMEALINAIDTLIEWSEQYDVEALFTD